MDTIGRRIVHIRKMRGYTQDDLSEIACISTQFLSCIENDRKSMTVSTLAKIAKSLDVSADYILFGEQNRNDRLDANALLSSLSDKDRQNAENILKIFVDSVRDKK